MSHPSFQRYRPLFSAGEWSRFLEALARPEPRTFRVRAGRMDPGEVVDRLRDQGFQVAPFPEVPGVFQVESEPFPLSETLEHWLGLLYIQQASTTLVAPLLDPRPGEAVADLCAAPGGKTAHLAELMEDRGCLLANDLSEKRVQALAGNLARLAHPGVVTLVGDALRLPESAPVHRVLLDVPCSGEGRARREGPGDEGAFTEASEGDLKRLPQLQEALLRKALRLVIPGGRVLYVTCTLAPEENEGVVDAVLREPREGPGGSPPARLVPLAPDLPHAPGLTRFEGATYLPELEGACRIHPHHLDSGGLFMALLEVEGPGAGGGLPRLTELPGWTLPRGRLPWEEGRGGQDVSTPPVPTGGEVGWLERGGALRFHTLEAWPFDAWAREGAEVRVMTVGLRGAEVDRRGGVRPSGDLLRWMGKEGSWDRGIELPDEAWLRLLQGTAVRVSEVAGGGRSPGASGPAPAGGVVLLHQGIPLATGRIRGGRIQHELPVGRARWLHQVLRRRGEGPPSEGPG